MMRGRPPKPAVVKLLTGNPGKRPINRDEPTTPPLRRTPPKHLDEQRRAVWREIVRSIPPGVLGQADALVVELAADLMLRFRGGDTRSCVLSNLRGCLATLGMDPSSRSRLKVPPATPRNPFDDL